MGLQNINSTRWMMMERCRSRLGTAYHEQHTCRELIIIFHRELQEYNNSEARSTAANVKQEQHGGCKSLHCVLASKFQEGVAPWSECRLWN